jgi:TrmH family RNA methyltransferase
MVSKKHVKFIQSLQFKKYRKQAQSFIVEGEKSVLELIHSNLKIKTIIATKRFLEDHFESVSDKDIEWIEASAEVLNKTGTFSQNQTALAVAAIPTWPSLEMSAVRYLPVYEFLQDPGNLGTILRICDWFGIDAIVLSNDSVDVFNPKVIQASMGSFTRVKIYYKNLKEFLRPTAGFSLVGTTLGGEDVHRFVWPEKGMILFGNESKGLSGDMLEKLDYRISVPSYGLAESLNVAVASGIVLDNLKRYRNGV